MKTAKRVLAVIIAVFMMVGTCAIAASAAGTLQARINAAAPGDTVKLTGYTTESVTINKNLTLDLNGYRLTGDYGSAAIKVTAGNVTVTNGQVDAMFRICTTQEMLETVFDTCPAAIYVSGGELTVDGVRIVGGQVRVPGTAVSDGIVVPAGSGIMSTNNAPVTIKRCSIYGDYGVNNKIRTMPEGGVVTVEDAIILSYNTAIKGEYAIADGSEEINAADRIAGVLNGGITLDEDEQEIVGNVLNDRTMIVVKYPETLTAMANAELNGNLDPEDEAYVDTTPTITVTPGNPTAEVVAPVLDYTWKNTASTDCSYKMVPYGVKMSDTGSIVDLDKVDATRVDTDCQVVYRVEYKIGDEAREYMDYVISDDPAVNKLDGCLGWAGIELDERYAEVVNANNNNKIDSYDEVVKEVADLMWMIDSIGAEEIPVVGGQVSDLQQYKDLRKLLYKVAGETAYNASADRRAKPGFEEFSAITYQNIFGEAMVEGQPVGTLDRIQALKDGLEETIGGSFKNTDKYGDLAVWFVDVAYPELIEGTADTQPILDELVANLQAIKDLLAPANEGEVEVDPNDSSTFWPAVVSELDLGDSLGLIDLAIDYGTQAQSLITDAFKNNDVKSTVDYIKAHKADVKRYVDKGVEVIENWRTYVTPSKFLAENNTFVKTFSMIGEMKLIEVPASGKLHLIVTGRGQIAFSNGTVYDGITPDGEVTFDVDFDGSFTLTAVPEDDDCEFLFWANREGGGNRILSTEPTFTMNTNASREIEAVYEEKNNPTVFFTNPTGDLCGSTNVFDNNGNAVISGIKNPFIAGYGFDGWAGSDNGLVLASSLNDVGGLTNYQAGNSAFANADVAYRGEGAVLKINPNSSSFIVTPKYSVNGTYTLTFYDAGEVYTANGTYSDLVTMTSNLEGDNVYWVDYNTRKPVCVTKTISHTIIASVAFESVSGTCGDAVTRTTVREEGTNVVFYVERSTTKTIAATGVLYIVAPEADFDLENDFVLNGEGVGKGTAKFTTLNGLYAPSFRLAWLNGRTVYVRPYIEFTDGSAPYYGEVVHN